MTTPLDDQLQRLLQRTTTLQPVIESTLRFGDDEQELVIAGGSVTLDRRRAQRATANINVAVKGALPAALTPLGGRLDIRAGVRSISGASDTVPLITDAVITRVDGLETDNAVINVQATERSERAARWRFERPFNVPINMVMGDAVNLVLNNRGLVSAVPSIGPNLRAGRVFGLDATKDPWSECIDLCDSFGYRLWLDRDGNPQLDQGPLPQEARPVLVLEPNVNMSSLPPNVISGRWEPTDGSPPVFAIAEDTDPGSPTFVGGPYGRVTFFFASPLPITQAGANQAVQTILQKHRYQGAGRAWTLPFDPTIDPDDIIVSSTVGRDAIVEAVTFDLGGNVSVEVSEVTT